MARVALLCGTGMGKIADSFQDSCLNYEKIRIDSPWGQVSCDLLQLGIGELLIIDRHHSDGDKRTPPHKIEHRANIHAASSFTPDVIISVNSVGTMVEHLPPGDIGIASDVLDLAIKPWTFHDDDATHVDRTMIFNNNFSEICKKSLKSSQGQAIDGLVVAQCIGPQFESPSEIDALVRLGADVVGMTLGPESRLIAEKKIPHVALSCSSNWAAGRTPGDRKAEIDHHSVDTMASTLRDRIKDCIEELMRNI
tara:strand:+ start:39065 stop:39820 length:756 start_codon:yes stop_codon:yes gene_type:complete